MIRSKSKNVESFKDLSNHHSSKIKITSWFWAWKTRCLSDQFSRQPYVGKQISWFYNWCFGSFWHPFLIHLDQIPASLEMQIHTLYLNTFTQLLQSLPCDLQDYHRYLHRHFSLGGVVSYRRSPWSKFMDPSHSSMNDNWWIWSTFQRTSRSLKKARPHRIIALDIKPESSSQPEFFGKKHGIQPNS